VGYRGHYLEALKLLWRFGSATTRRGILGRGLLMESAGTPTLGERLGLSGGVPARARASGLLTVLGAPLMPFTSIDLQERISEEGENMIGMLEGKG
jgi:hypothetical protein